jgi:hypothetical protein
MIPALTIHPSHMKTDIIRNRMILLSLPGFPSSGMRLRMQWRMRFMVIAALLAPCCLHAESKGLLFPPTVPSGEWFDFPVQGLKHPASGIVNRPGGGLGNSGALWSEIGRGLPQYGHDAGSASACIDFHLQS